MEFFTYGVDITALPYTRAGARAPLRVGIVLCVFFVGVCFSIGKTREKAKYGAILLNFNSLELNDLELLQRIYSINA